MLRISWEMKVTNEIVLRKAKIGREMLKGTVSRYFYPKLSYIFKF